MLKPATAQKPGILTSRPLLTHNVPHNDTPILHKKLLLMMINLKVHLNIFCYHQIL